MIAGKHNGRANSEIGYRIKIFTCYRKRLRFCCVQTGYYIREKLIKCLTESIVTGYGFDFDEFWVNNGMAVLLLLSVRGCQNKISLFFKGFLHKFLWML